MDGSLAMTGATGMMSADPSQLVVQQQQQQQQMQQQQQQQFMQQYGNVNSMPTMQPQFWTGATPEQGMNPQAPIFVASQAQPSNNNGGGVSGGGNNNPMRMNMMGQAEEPMRIMFNSNVSFGNIANNPMSMQQAARGPMSGQQMMPTGMQYAAAQGNVNNGGGMMQAMSAATMGGRPGGLDANGGMQAMAYQTGGMNMGMGVSMGGGLDDGSGANNGGMNMGGNMPMNTNNHRGGGGGGGGGGGYDDYGNNSGANNHNNNAGSGNNGGGGGHRDRRDYNHHHHNGGERHYRDRHNNNHGGGHHHGEAGGGGGAGGGGHMRHHNNRGGDMNNNGGNHHGANSDGRNGPKGEKGHRGGGGGGSGGNNNSGNGNGNGGGSGGNSGGGSGGGGSSYHGTHAPRDALVDEFRSSFGKPGRTWTLKELSSHIVAFCQDQHGSRFIQQRLEVCSEGDKQLVFDEVLPSAHVLMTDVFGNYVLQKLFEYGGPEQCESLAAILRGQAVALSMQMYGCRVVQKALEYVSRERLVELVREFEAPQALIDCVHDSNGNHVIQKCIEVVSKAARVAESPDMEQYLSGRIQFIIDQFQGQVKELSSHPYGCRVVQRILEHCTNSQKDVVLEELRACCGELIQDCYGNYVIQFVMQHGCEADQAILMKDVMDNLLEYSQHKFASNVVEKCLQFASHKDRNDMIWKIINATFDLANPVDKMGHCFLETMVRDPYANYVVQKIIEVSDERQRGAIMRYVKDNITQLRKYTYGKHIIICLEKITNEKF